MCFENLTQTLSVFLAYGFPSFEGKKIIIKTILECLDYLHKKGIFHGNIAANSILVLWNNEQSGYRVKLGQFQNCGYFKESENEIASLRETDLKATGTLLLYL